MGVIPQRIENFPEFDKDHYHCPKCDKIPEILNIHFDTHYIDLNCEEHGKLSLDVYDYLLNELKMFYSKKCDKCKRKFKDCEDNECFKYCYDCQKDLCSNHFLTHSESHKNNCIDIKEKSIKCNKHCIEKPFIEYCKECKEHVCIKERKKHLNHLNKIIDIKEDFINIDEKIKKIKEKNKKLEQVILFNNIIINTQKKFPNNYYHIKNIFNIAEAIENEEKHKKENEITQMLEDLSEKVNVEKNQFKQLCQKIKRSLNGSEETLILSNYSLNDSDLQTLVSMPFEELKFLELGDNCLKNISALEKLKAPKLEQIDLQGNNIESIEPLKKLGQASKSIKVINLKGNKISNIDILREDIFPNLQLLDISLNNINEDIKSTKEIVEKYKGKITYSPIKFKDFYEKYNIRDLDFTQDIEALYLGEIGLKDQGLIDLYNINFDFSILIELYLPGNRIGNISYMCFYKLRNLEKLDLSYNEITNIEPLADISLPRLNSLYLKKNKIRNIEVFTKIEYKNLVFLNIEKNKIDFKKQENSESLNYLLKKKIEVVFDNFN